MDAQKAFTAKAVTWLKATFKSRRTIKTWIRCCISLAISLIYLCATKTSKAEGQAAFFASILAVLLPPSFALSMFLFVSTTLIIGMLFGWAWGCAAMASALSVRDQARLARQVHALQSSLVLRSSYWAYSGTPTALQYESAIFHGQFLDPRSSAVFGAFFFIGTFFFSTVVAYRPKLALFSIFGSIVLDLMCLYGPVFPISQYTLAKLFLIPTGFYLATALACLICIFPESLNHVWLSLLGGGVLKPVLDIIDLQAETLQTSASDHEAFERLIRRGKTYRTSLVVGFQGLQGQISFIDLESSMGRLGAADLKQVNKELKTLTNRTAGLLAFQTAVDNLLVAHAKAGHDEDPKSNKAIINRSILLLRDIRAREVKHGLDLETLVPLLSNASKTLNNDCSETVKIITTWFKDCNNTRWSWLFSKPSPEKMQQRQQGLVEQLNVIKKSLDHFRNVERVQLIRPFERFFDPVTGRLLASVKEDAGTSGFSVRSLFICFVFCDTLEAFADSLIKLLTLIVYLDEKRPEPRLWMPIGYGSLGGRAKGTGGTNKNVSPFAMGAPTDPFKFEESLAESQDTLKAESEKDEMEAGVVPRDPDALPPKSALGKFSLKLTSAVRFLWSPEGVYAMRYGLVSIALWIPYVCSSSVWFVYQYRGIWAVIMAQIGLAVFAGDQIYSYGVRLIGTGIGLLNGLVAWYIGAARGNGNPYGIVIITVSLTAPFVLKSITCRPSDKPFWSMIGVTTVFVVGYSWVDAHQVMLANTGKGIDIAWKRALLIIIGFTAGFIVMIVPRLTSSRLFVRRSLAAITDELGNIFASEVEAFLAEERKTRLNSDAEKDHTNRSDNVSTKEQRIRMFTPRMLAIATRLQELQPTLTAAKWEPHVSGQWPYEQYTLLHMKLTRLLSTLNLLVAAMSRMDERWCGILVHHTPFMNPSFLSDVFTQISVISSCLSGARPLPPAFFNLKDRIIYHERRARVVRRRHAQIQEEVKDGDSDSSDSDVEDSTDHEPEKVDSTRIGIEELTLQVLMAILNAAVIIAVISLSSVVTLLDDISSIIKDLCGETSFSSLDMLHRRFLTFEEETLGHTV
ncbi:uncharacterized protein BT62DRAFT_913251 [Guyanagaster necrorhizus]|uniref:ER transporter 6TM N-terminal domain-containing protein n=1 Tax=Guyanagaster necrorhizus TaxID=856835 RepID=A0A9P7VFC8_9AGAR|nr:uncharacterized protein BT62DRAFT_913251 [Guyanagaster necrorhizus MCA 3950]KAG7439538.1 hypothetical protein BT62DRAFT_913251 [Guyanagaster necrorhizus MCA 3950]